MSGRPPGTMWSELAMDEGDIRDIKVSVIIPVYNAEPYLRQCLDSIAAQTLRDIEIICVDDGSDDGSPEILREYAEKDGRFTVLHQQNLYAGVARNLGKLAARGEYLAFVDADDFFEPDLLEAEYAQCTRYGADICVCGFDDYGMKTGGYCPDADFLRYCPAVELMNPKEYAKYLYQFVNPVVWNKMFRRSFAEETGLDFRRRGAPTTCISFTLWPRLRTESRSCAGTWSTTATGMGPTCRPASISLPSTSAQPFSRLKTS